MSNAVNQLNMRMQIINKYLSENAPILNLEVPTPQDIIAENPEVDTIPRAFASKLTKLRGVIRMFNESVTSIFVNLFIGSQSGKGDSIVVNGDQPLTVEQLNEDFNANIDSFNTFEFNRKTYTIESILTTKNRDFIQGFIDSLDPDSQSEATKIQLARRR